MNDPRKSCCTCPPLEPWHWLAFGALVPRCWRWTSSCCTVPIAPPRCGNRLGLVAFWCLLALGFNAFVAWWRGPAAGLEFLTGYLLEWSLSMDNVFVFAVIFRYFQVPLNYQYRVLFWGILGAILMRLGFVLGGGPGGAVPGGVADLRAGAALGGRGSWPAAAPEQIEPGRNPVLRLARRCLRSRWPAGDR